MKTFSRQQIVEGIYKRFGGAVPKLVLHDAIRAICEDLEERLSTGETVVIHNFGIFHLYKFKGRINVDINSKELRETKSFDTIQFIPDDTFSDLIERRKSYFNQKK